MRGMNGLVVTGGIVAAAVAWALWEALENARSAQRQLDIQNASLRRELIDARSRAQQVEAENRSLLRRLEEKVA